MRRQATARRCAKRCNSTRVAERRMESLRKGQRKGETFMRERAARGCARRRKRHTRDTPEGRLPHPAPTCSLQRAGWRAGRHLGQELADGAVVAVGNLWGRCTRLMRRLTVAVVVVKQPGNGHGQQIDGRDNDRQFTALHPHQQAPPRTLRCFHPTPPAPRGQVQEA